MEEFHPILSSILAAKLQGNKGLCCFTPEGKGRVVNLVTRYARQGDSAGLRKRALRKYITKNVRREYSEPGAYGFVGWVVVLQLILQAVQIFQAWRDRRNG